MVMDAHYEQSLQVKPFCKIRGRIISAADFHSKLGMLCNYHGMEFDENRIVRIAAAQELEMQLAPIRELPDSTSQKRADTVIVIEAKIPYEPSWGGFGSLPKSVLNLDNNFEPQDTSSGFIEPYLAQYRLACRSVHLGCDCNRLFTVIIPEVLLGHHGNANRQSLSLALDGLVRTDSKGGYLPVAIHGTNHVLELTEQGVQAFADSGFMWQENRIARVGHHLPSALLHFEPTEASVEKELLHRVLLPEMAAIVTDSTPHLRAAEILLLHQFSKYIETLQDVDQKISGRLLVIAVLNINMRALGEDRAGYFIPWKAYLSGTDQDEPEASLDLDEFFAELMRQ